MRSTCIIGRRKAAKTETMQAKNTGAGPGRTEEYPALSKSVERDKNLLVVLKNPVGLTLEKGLFPQTNRPPSACPGKNPCRREAFRRHQRTVYGSTNI